MKDGQNDFVSIRMVRMTPLEFQADSVHCTDWYSSLSPGTCDLGFVILNIWKLFISRGFPST